MSFDNVSPQKSSQEVFYNIVDTLGGKMLPDGSAMVLCLAHADKNPSLHVTNTEDKNLVHCYAGCSQESVISGLRDRGLWPEKINGKKPSIPSEIPSGVYSEWGKGTDKKQYKAHWTYHDFHGNIIGYTVRYENSTGKDIIPYFKKTEPTYGSVNPEPKWRPGAPPEPRPLYNSHLRGRDKMSDHKPNPTLIVEGEKACDAAKSLVGHHYDCMTWQGGAKAAIKADFSGTKGYDCFIWPDADEPGHKAALSVQEQCLKAGAKSCAIISPPPGVSTGWDLADAKHEGWTTGQVLDYIRDNCKSPEKTKDKIEIISFHDVVQKDVEVKYIADNFLIESDPVVIAGAGGLGKSMLFLYMAYQFALLFCNNINPNNDKLFSLFPVPKPRTSLFIQSENGISQMRYRALQIAGTTDEGREPLKYIYTPFIQENILSNGMSFINSKGLIIDTIHKTEDASQQKLDIVCLDPLVSFIDCNENENVEMRRELDALTEIAMDCKITPITAHHNKKDDSTLRGASAIRDWCRNLIELKRDWIVEPRLREDGSIRNANIPVVNISSGKSNNMRPFEPFTLRMKQNFKFELINKEDHMTPEKNLRCNAVVEALQDLPGMKAYSTNQLVKIYCERSGIGTTAARNHISETVDYGFIIRESVSRKGSQTYEYKMP